MVLSLGYETLRVGLEYMGTIIRDSPQVLSSDSDDYTDAGTTTKRMPGAGAAAAAAVAAATAAVAVAMVATCGCRGDCAGQDKSE